MTRTFEISGSGELPPTEVVLLRPASATHFFDFDQRYIELAFTLTPGGDPGEWTATVEAPTDDLGPAGWYMLFVIAETESLPGAPGQRVPSPARFIKFE